jgi:putative transposase
VVNRANLGIEVIHERNAHQFPLDLHHKVANFLTTNYKVIFLPSFKTSEMVLKSKRKINRKSVRNMLTWSHYRFAQHLTQMAARRGVLVVRLSEAYTSKTCGKCGHIHKKLGGSKTYKCPKCGTQIPRDINGARKCDSFSRNLAIGG